MDKLLTRYWFRSRKGLGVGVTAFNVEDARSLIRLNTFLMSYEPIFDSYIENVNIHDLDQNHVIPNMGVVVDRGIWYPRLTL
jgi:hypothetical protein